MSNIHSSVCYVIPRPLLRNIARRSEDEATRRGAERSLDVMQALGAERRQALIAPNPRRSGRKRSNVYTAEHEEVVPGTIVRRDGYRAVDDVEVNEAYDGSRAVYDFYFHVFGRRSVDGAGMRLDSTVHYGSRFDNALWNGRQMIYGDGDGKLFKRFTGDPGVIAHELTHGVIQFTAALSYAGQTGALNEHLADAFGSMFKQWMLRQSVALADWLIGAAILGPHVHGKALRSMAAPGTAYDDPVLGRDPQPAHMRHYVRGDADNGGVHVNSGILNHAFYLLNIEVGGYSWERPGELYYTVQTTELAPNADFADFAYALVAVAAKLFRQGGRVYRAVRSALESVGIIVPKPPRPPIKRPALLNSPITNN